MRDQLIQDCRYEPIRVFELLLNTAQFEFVLSEMFRKLLDLKYQNWLIDKDECSSRLRELGEVRVFQWIRELKLTRASLLIKVIVICLFILM